MSGAAADPTPDQVAGLPAYEVPALADADMDGNGHLTVHDHVRVAAFGAHVVLSAAGMTPERRLVDGATVFTAEHHVRYRHELRSGVTARVHARVVDLGRRSIHLVGYLLDLEAGRIATVLEALVVSVDLGSRRVVPFPADIDPVLVATRDEHANLNWTPLLSGAIGIRPEDRR